MKSIRSYQREIKELKDLLEQVQWVRPSYNGSDSCSGCGNQRHIGCGTDCPVAEITKDFGETENITIL